MIRLRHLLFVVSYCAPAIAWAAPEQTAPRDVTTFPALSPAAPGSLRGIVTRADSGDPLPGALVSIMPEDSRSAVDVGSDGIPKPATFPEAFTDARGRFVIEPVPAGRYLVRASKTGYVWLLYGQRTSTGRARRVEVAPAASVDDVAIVLPRGAVIGGQVLDEHGEPLRGARVRAIPRRAESGTALFTARADADRTDDLGRFRIHGLPAGSYVIEVAAVTAADPAFELPWSFVRADTPVTYYPAARSASDAEQLRVGTGEEVDGLTVQMQPAITSAIVATVRAADGQPVPDATVVLNTRHANGGISSHFVSRRDDGSYVTASLPPGSYGLHARGHDGTVAATSVRLDGTHVDVPLTLGPGGTLRARVFVNGGQPPRRLRPDTVTVQLLPDDGDLQMPEGQRLSDGWTLEIGSLTGRNRLRVRVPDGVALQHLTRRGADGKVDVTDTAIDFSSGATIDVEIHLTDLVTRLSGVVRDTQGSAISDASVIVFADDRSRWSTGSRFVAVAHPNQAGRFTAAGLPPGRYLAVALADLEEGEQPDTALLERLRTAATPVTLVEGEAKTVDIPLAAR